MTQSCKTVDNNKQKYKESKRREVAGDNSKLPKYIVTRTGRSQVRRNYRTFLYAFKFKYIIHYDNNTQYTKNSHVFKERRVPRTQSCTNPPFGMLRRPHVASNVHIVVINPSLVKTNRDDDRKFERSRGLRNIFYLLSFWAVQLCSLD